MHQRWRMDLSLVFLDEWLRFTVRLPHGMQLDWQMMMGLRRDRKDKKNN